MSILKYAYINHAMVSRWTRYGTGNKDATSWITLAMLTSEPLPPMPEAVRQVSTCEIALKKDLKKGSQFANS